MDASPPSLFLESPLLSGLRDVLCQEPLKIPAPGPRTKGCSRVIKAKCD